MRINPVLTRLGDYPIAAVHEKVAELRSQGTHVIDFSIGDPREPTPPFIRQALIDAVPVSSQYPLTAGIAELRQAVADYVRRRFDVDVDPDTQVMPTSGSKEAVFSAPLAFVDRDGADIVAYGTPGYPIYQRGALFAGADVHEVLLHDDFVLRAADISDDVWERAAIVWTCTPHNPTGAVTDAATLTDLLDAARGHGSWLFSDECYADVYEPLAFPDGPGSLLQAAGAGATGVLAFFSCSKRSGMTGYRSGAMVGDADAISRPQEAPHRHRHRLARLRAGRRRRRLVGRRPRRRAPGHLRRQAGGAAQGVRVGGPSGRRLPGRVVPLGRRR